MLHRGPAATSILNSDFGGDRHMVLSIQVIWQVKETERDTRSTTRGERITNGRSQRSPYCAVRGAAAMWSSVRANAAVIRASQTEQNLTIQNGVERRSKP